jgi:hypothetical protein
MDAAGNMPGEPGYASSAQAIVAEVRDTTGLMARPQRRAARSAVSEEMGELVAVGADGATTVQHGTYSGNGRGRNDRPHFNKFNSGGSLPEFEEEDAVTVDLVENGHGKPVDLTMEKVIAEVDNAEQPKHGPSFGKVMHEVFLNPGIFLLFAGLAIGFISRLQGEAVVAKNDAVFVSLFQGLLCLFLLEMGMTAANRLKDLKKAGWQFVAFALIAPNVFASFGIGICHLYSMWLGQPFGLGTYVLFAVLCGAASYIAVPAVQRIAIPEASPTLPLAASLGLTFSYNVTVGIPVYLMLATALTTSYPVGVVG